MAINSPYVPGDPYSYDLKWMVRKLKELSAAANTAAEAAAALVTTQVVINCDSDAGTAEIDSELTWEEIIEAVQNEKVLFRLVLSNEVSGTIRPYHYGKLTSSGANDTLQISDISADGGDVPITRINADKAYFVNSKTGYYQHAYATV